MPTFGAGNPTGVTNPGGTVRKPKWKDTVDAGLLALTFAGGVGAAGKLAKGEKLLEGSKAVEKALPAIEKVTGSKAWQIGKWTPRAAIAGYAASHPKETAAVAAGTAEALWESPGKVAKSTGRAAISSLAFPFAVGANAIQSVKEGSTDPLEHMADDQKTVLKHMADVYTSGDSEKIQKLTEDEMGAMGIIMAYYGLRPAWKGPVRAGAKATSEALAARALKEGPEGGPATKLNNAIRAVEGRRLRSQAKTAAGRASALEAVIKEDMTSREMGVRSGMNPAFKVSNGRKRAIQKKSDAWNKADLKGRKPGTEPVDITQAAVFAATKGLLDSEDGAKVVMTDANLRRASRRIAPDAADQPNYAAGAAGTFMQAVDNPMGKMFAKAFLRCGRQPNLIVSNIGAWTDYHNALVKNERYERALKNVKMAESGFESLMYRGATWITDPLATRSGAGVEAVYVLDTNAFDVYWDPRRKFYSTPWREPYNQSTRVMYLKNRLELIFRERRSSGVITVSAPL